MNADDSAADRPSASICVHLRFIMEKLFLISRHLKTYGLILKTKEKRVSGNFFLQTGIDAPMSERAKNREQLNLGMA